MPNKKHSEWRKTRINDIKGGSGINETHIKQSVDVINSVIEDLEDSINKIAEASNRLSKVLVFATVIIALVALADLYIRVTDRIDNDNSKVTCNLSK